MFAIDRLQEAAVAALRDSERAEVKQAFASFNATLQQLAGEQACWAIPDTTLRDRLKGTIRAQVNAAFDALVFPETMRLS